MQAKHNILDLWQRAVAFGCGRTFELTYGSSTGTDRFCETLDAFGREDVVRIIKSVNQLKRDLPADGWQHWPALLTLFEIDAHMYDEDYPSSKPAVVSGTRDPNINMYSETVTEDMMSDAGPEDFNYATDSNTE